MGSDTIEYKDFEKVDIRVGRIVSVEKFPEGKFSSHILIIDLGDEIGKKKSLARLTPNYDDVNLVDEHVLCVVNFKSKQIGPHKSEVLTLGVPGIDGNVVLVKPEREAPVGGRLY